MKQYFDSLIKDVDEIYTIANEARKKGFDPSLSVEMPIAKDIADRVQGLVGPKGVGKRIRELEANNMPREKIAFKIAEEIALGNFFTDEKEKLAEKAVRTALAIITESITAAPLEGIAKVTIQKNDDNSEYIAVYYAGPIRSAGGTAAGMSVLLADHVRQVLNLDRYKPSRQEVDRYLEEIELYKRVMHLQLPTSKDEQRFAAENIPVEITGEPTNDIEVSGNRNLKRVTTNKLRGGAILVFNDGLVGRAKKISKRVSDNNLKGWEWLKELLHIHEQSNSQILEEPSDKLDDEDLEEDLSEEEDIVKADSGYIKDVIAGRPVFAHPSAKGGFRMRYGRSRATGLAALGIHPALMGLTNDFLACGTHIRTERPGKGSIVLPVDTIHPPIVKLKNGDVMKVVDYEHSLKIRDEVEEILFLGDMLHGFGEFNQCNYNLIPAGYCEEWWIQELQKTIVELSKVEQQRLLGKLLRIAEDLIKNFLTKIPKPNEAILFSKLLNIPLHPEFTYMWHDLTSEKILELRQYLLEKGEKDENQLIVPDDKKVKEILETLCVPHKIRNNAIILDEHAEPLIISLGLKKNIVNISDDILKKPLKLINFLSDITIKDKCPIYTGARMGRPEKAKERKMRPPVHLLFPIEEEGGRLRDLYSATKGGKIEIEIKQRSCPKCNKMTQYPLCNNCKIETVEVLFCPRCTNRNRKLTGEKCPSCGRATVNFTKIEYDIESDYNRAIKSLGLNRQTKVKAVKKLMSKDRTPELIEKGILRAQYSLYVYRDGTIRFDATDAVLTHFKPNEVNVPVHQLLKCGYTTDISGEPLRRADQIVELKIQDIVINEEGAKYLLSVSKFIDDLLEKVYGLSKYYNASKVSDLVGKIVIGLAPHTSAGIVGRIVGFTKAKVIFAHPYWHAAKRRNCDGDEDSIILGLDAFLNFSTFYLPSIRGGMMDAPLVLVATLNPFEVDDESHNVDTGTMYPIAFYESTYNYESPKNVLNLVDIVSNRLSSESAYEGFKYTHETSNIFQGPLTTNYKLLKTMRDKVEAQLFIAKLIKAVDMDDVASKIITNHFIPDLFGNLRRFGSQKIRCTKCNQIYRRIPLTGICSKCKSTNLNLTVFEKSITKYLEIAEDISVKYGLSEYLKNRISVIKHNIESLFGKQAFASHSKKPNIKDEKTVIRLSDFLPKDKNSKM